MVTIDKTEMSTFTVFKITTIIKFKLTLDTFKRLV